MDDNRLPKIILNYRPEGRRNIGRPETRWEDDFREEGTGQEAYALWMMMIIHIANMILFIERNVCYRRVINTVKVV